MKKTIFALIFMLVGVIAVSCSKDNDSNNGGNEEPNTTNIVGTVQKGPFITGTSIKVQVLDSNLNPTGKSFESQIIDDFGNFSISVPASIQYAEVIATGYYFDEVGGWLSSSPITLRSISKIVVGKPVNVNILTTLQSARLKKLVQNDKVSFANATKQSAKEVLKAFNIDYNDMPDFDNLSIAKGGDANAIALAISAVMQSYSSVAELTELTAKIANDISDNGVLDQPALIQSIRGGNMSVNAAKVRQNLIDRYVQLGQNDVSAPDFHDWLDSDGDGVSNKDTQELKFRISMGYSSGTYSRATSDELEGESINPLDLVTNITAISFDNTGKIFFVEKFNKAQIKKEYHNYSCSFSISPIPYGFYNGDYTTYVIADSPYDYSNFKGTHNDLLNSDLVANTSIDNVENMMIGKGTYSFVKGKANSIGVSMKHSFVKVRVDVQFDSSIPQEQQVVNLVVLNGVLCSTGSVFNSSKSGYPTSDLVLTKVESGIYEGYVFNGSNIFNLTLGTGAGVKTLSANHNYKSGDNLIHQCKVTINNYTGTEYTTNTIRRYIDQSTILQ